MRVVPVARRVTVKHVVMRTEHQDSSWGWWGEAGGQHRGLPAHLLLVLHEPRQGEGPPLIHLETLWEEAWWSGLSQGFLCSWPQTLTNP